MEESARPWNCSALLDPPDSWYIPYVNARLQLPVATRRPIRVEVLMNASPSGPSRGLNTGTANSRNLANLVPALKVFSQMEVAGGSLHITLLDISNRRVIFEQDAVRQLDWTRLRDALTDADPNKIDVKSLEHREQNASYFLQQVRERLGSRRSPAPAANEPLHVLIVLAAPMTLDSGDKATSQSTRKRNRKACCILCATICRRSGCRLVSNRRCQEWAGADMEACSSQPGRLRPSIRSRAS